MQAGKMRFPVTGAAREEHLRACSHIDVLIRYRKEKQRVEINAYPITIERGMVVRRYNFCGQNADVDVVAEPMARLNRKRLEAIYLAERDDADIGQGRAWEAAQLVAQRMYVTIDFLDMQDPPVSG